MTRFGVGELVVEPRIEGRFARRVGAGMHAHPLLPGPEMAQDALGKAEDAVGLLFASAILQDKTGQTYRENCI